MKYFLSVCFLAFFSLTHAQDPNRFIGELENLQKKYDSIWDASKETIVFTGSSSIRMWKDLPKLFPQHQIINTGFGGSQASDLLAHLNKVALQYNPKKIFIYEGDNDIQGKKKPKEIITTLNKIIEEIKTHDQNTKVVVISAKPSISRWNLKGKYKKLNRKMSRLAKNNPLVEYCNIWNIMLNKRKLKKDIFIQDGLHMNSKGYSLWYPIVKKYIN